MDPEPLQRTIPAQPEAIAPLRHEVQAYGVQLGVADPFGLALAVSETVTNAVLHAYVGAPTPGDIVIHAQREPGDGMRLIVSDEGSGMVPRPDSPGLGLGLPLVAHFAERFEVSDRPGGGTEICMVFSSAG